MARDVGRPGAPPFTRGVHAAGYRGKPWTMRMFAGFGAAEDTNARFRYLLDAGQTGLSIAYDMPTLYGYDTDDPEARASSARAASPSAAGRHGGAACRTPARPDHHHR